MRGSRRRQLLLSWWLMLTGLTIGLMLGYSMWLRWQGALAGSRDWFGFAVLVMLLSVYVSDVIRGVRRIPDRGGECCPCHVRHLE